MNRMLYVYKSMWSKLHNDRRSHFIFILFIGLTGTMFLSRAFLSGFILLFVLICFFHPAVKQHWTTFISNPLLWGMSLLFLLPLVSGLWSNDKEEWVAIMRIKLPLLLLPLAFAAPFSFSKKQWDWLAYIFIGLIMGGTIWSMFQYLPQSEAVHQGYLQAKSIITPLENDHVRFSWLVSVTVLMAGWLCYQKKQTQKNISIVLALIVVWLIVFLHVLAARTGLLSFYIMLLMAAIWSVYRNISKRNGLLLFAALIVLPVMAYFTLPTFQNKVRYIRYDFDYFSKASYLPGANDAVRVISMKAGWNVFTENPITGVGFGDVFAEVKNQYAVNYPQMQEPDKIYPSSEWLMYGAGCGLIGLIIFGWVMAIPFFTEVTNRLPWYLLNSTAAFSFLFDIGLEVQYGVFIYAFIVLWWWKLQQAPVSHKNI
jgi:O-antigen ligase